MLNNHQIRSKRSKLLQDTAQRKEHFKMYKAGRNWLYAGITVLFFGSGMYFSTLSVNADTVSQSTSSTEVVSSSIATSASDTSTPSSAASSSTSASVTKASQTEEVSSAETESVPSATSESASSATSTTSASSSVTSTSSETSSAAASSASSLTKESSAAASENNGSSSASEASASTSSENLASAVTTSSATASSTANAQETSLASSSAVSETASAAASSSADDDQANLASLKSELPSGSTVTVESDGSLLIALPSGYDDIALVQQVVDDSQIKRAVKITAKDADATTAGPITYSSDTSSNVYTTVLNSIAGADTMADFEWITAVGTGMLNGKSATLDEIDNYFKADAKANPDNYHLFTAIQSSTTTNESTLESEANAASFVYYYFISSPNSYLNALISYLGNLSDDDLAQMAQDAYDDATGLDINQLITQASKFVKNDYYPAGNGGTTDLPSGSDSFSVPTSWNMDSATPSGTTLTADQSANLQTFINGIVSLYIGAIVPGAEEYVINKVLPAVDTVSDTQTMTNYSSIDDILSETGQQSYQLAKALMSINGKFSLTSIVPKISMLYQKYSILAALSSSDVLGVYVGAISGSDTTDGQTLAYNDATQSGNAIAYPNFSLFDSLYVTYSQALVKILYGYAMLGKYQVIDAMYKNTDAMVAYMSTITDPSQIEAAKIEALTGSSYTIPTDTTLETFQQGAWDVYNYIYPFYKAALEDKANGTEVTKAQYTTDGVFDNDAYLKAVWATASKQAVTGDGEIQGYAENDDNTRTLTLDYSENTTDSNQHDVANTVSLQTIQYLADFYTNTVNAPAGEVNYVLQPVSRVVVYGEDGTTVLSVTDTPISDPTDTLDGVAGETVDISSLPTVTGYTTPNSTTIVIPENGGTVNVPYNPITKQTAGTETVASVNAPSTATYSYEIDDSNGNVVDSGTDLALSDDNPITFDLDVGQTLIVSAASNTDEIALNGATSYTVPYDKSGGTVTFIFGEPEVSYTIQPVDKNGTLIGKAIQASGVPGEDADITLLPTIKGYTKPTTLEKIPADGGTINAVYTADAEIEHNNGSETNPVSEVTVTRTIHHSGAGLQTPEDVVQNVVYKAVTNKTTGETSWTPEGYYDEVNIPTIKGYTAEPSNVVTSYPKAVVLVEGKQPTDDIVNVIYTKDATVTVDPKDPKDPTDPIDPSNPEGPTYPEGLGEKDLNKTISRTITYKGAGDKTPTAVTQTAVYERTATVDAKTGELLSYGEWTLVTSDDDNDTNDGFTAVESPKVLGYTAAPTTVAATDLSNTEISEFEAKSADTTVTYTKDATVTVDPKDPKDPTDPIDPSNPEGPTYPEGVGEKDLNKTISRTITYTGAGEQTPTAVTQTAVYERTATVDAKTGELLGYGDWTLVTSDDDDDTNDGFTKVTSPKVLGYTADPSVVTAADLSSDEISEFEAKSADTTVTYTKDATVTVDPKDPQDPTDPIDPSNPEGPTYPEGVGEKDLNKTISRTITYTGAGEQTPTAVTQTAVYERTATVDAKTGELLGYGDWTLVTSDDDNDTNDGFTAVESPKVLGYTAAPTTVAATDLSNDEISDFEAQSADTTVIYTADDTVKVTQPTDPTQPVDPSNPNGPKMPVITADDLSQTISRTISYVVQASNNPNVPATPKAVTQTNTYTRSAIVDTKTGELLGYTDWVVSGSNKFVEVDSPQLENYQANPTQVAGVDLTNSEVESYRAGTTQLADQEVLYKFVGTVTTTKDPDGGTTTVTKNPEGEVTDVNKTWPDGDKTHVHVDVDTGVETVVETPHGEQPLPTVTVNPGKTVTIGETTVHNDEPKGVVTLTHDSGNGQGTLVTIVDKDGNVMDHENQETQPETNKGSQVENGPRQSTKTNSKGEQVKISGKLGTTNKVVLRTGNKHFATDQTKATRLPQTDEQNDETGAIIGLSFIGALLGLVGIKRRKRDED
ncbi:mucin-binding protein [Pediococcus siamensis]|uniref:mucin-binding protein n=1 Tax=Pediococcus siamensis TaxID=381829 RepID=UPI0039A3B4BC